MEPFYRVLREDPAGQLSATALVRATTSTVGPWDERHQHAGPPSALLARAVSRLGGLPDGLLTRATVDVLAPVPVCDLLVSARVLRPGRRVALAEATLVPARDVGAVGSGTGAGGSEAGRPVLRLTAWVIREADPAVAVPSLHSQAGHSQAGHSQAGHSQAGHSQAGTVVANADPGDKVAPAGGKVQQAPPGWTSGYLDAVRWAWVTGRFSEPGPATVWTRLRVPLVDGEEPDGVQRVLVVADSGNGISALADPSKLLFVNTDLTVHLLRRPVGEDIWMSAATALDPAGIGLATSRLGDATGCIGVGAQSLFVDARTSP